MKTNTRNSTKVTGKSSVVEALESRIAPAFMSAGVDLGALTAAIGSAVAGAAQGDNFGHSVSDAGDVNGDGIGDLIIGAPFAGSNGGTQGAAYLVFGKEGGISFPSFASQLDPNKIVAIYGEADGDRFGASVAGAGDVNGDGYADVIIGAPKADANGVQRGEAYVVYGHGGAFATTFDAGTVDGKTGFKVYGGLAMDGLGSSVAGAGDFNGDGLDDVIIGATAGDGDAVDSGAAYVIFGKTSRTSTSYASLPFDLGEGVKLLGSVAGDRTGVAVAGGGDVNGDGFADVIVGANLADAGGATTGIGYVVYGKAAFSTTNSFALSGVGGASGFRINGFGAGDQGGSSVAILKDLNGDGFDEVGIGAPAAEGGGTLHGAAYVVFGKAAGGGSVNAGILTGTDGFALTGTSNNDLAGISIHSAGDINGDGHNDLIVGASGATINNVLSGGAYVVYGKTGPYDATKSLGSLTLKDGLRLQGATAGSATGISVAGIGDVNHDGYNDLVVGAEFSGGGQMGSARILYGGPTGADLAPTYSANGKTATFTDVDGDKVTVTVTKGDLHNADFDLFSANGASALFTKLKLGSTFQGSNLTISAKPTAAGGDGRVDLGFLDATGVDLAVVNISGNLEQLDVGNANLPASALKSLTVGSLGIGTLPTHDTGGDDYISNITGHSGLITVKGNINQASLSVGGNLGGLTVGGSLIGGDTLFSGVVQTVGNGNIGLVKIGHDLRAGHGIGSGGINSDGKLAGVTIGGSQIGNATTGGYVRSDLDMGNVSIGHDQVNASILSLGKIGKVAVGGSLLLTEADSFHGITAATSVGQVLVKGDIVGLADASYIIQGGGALTGKTSVAVTSVTVNGSVENASILGGLSNNNGHAQIGAIIVNGNWTASSIVAGANTGAKNNASIFFGNADDTALTAGTSTAVARIASIVIKGEVNGTTGSGDHFGFVAKQIGSVKINNILAKLTKNTTDAPIEIGATSDFTIRELA